MAKFIIKRDGFPPLAFTGELIGYGDNEIGSDGNRSNRWTEIEIYRTQAGKYVGCIRSFTCWQGERDRVSAASKATAAEIIEWLRGEEETIGRVSQEAVEDAAKIDPAFAAAWVEEVE